MWEIKNFILKNKLFFSYIFSLLLLLLATVLIHYIFYKEENKFLYVLYYPAVILSSLYGGIVQGVLITIYSSLIIFKYWKSIFSLHEYIALIIFIGNCILISYIIEFVIIANKKVEEEKKKVEGLEFYNSLTGLPNRKYIIETLQRILNSILKEKFISSLIYVDIDNFSVINDIYGGKYSDSFLKEIAFRLSSLVRKIDKVFHVGDDKFAIILGGLSSNFQEAVLQTKIVSEKILTSIKQPIILDDSQKEIHSTASIGCTMMIGIENSVDEVLKQSEIAMHYAKTEGRDTVRFYCSELQETLKNRLDIETDLRLALKNNEFVLYYQPQIKNNKIIGAEALIRWKHPIKGLIYPNDFIHIAEETNLIIELGNWVIKKACEQILEWQKVEETKDIIISVNVSIKQFQQANFVNQVISILKYTNIDATRLKIELTESMLATDLEEIILKMNTLKVYGISFSLDDFGTGFSSLSYLKKLPLDQLKLDKSFVRDVSMHVICDNNYITKTIILLARVLGLSIIAEGVETTEQFDFLVNQECDIHQGYLYSKPIMVKDFEKYVLDFNIKNM